MTPFSALQSLCGLSNREAADYLNVPESTVEKWRKPPSSPSARNAPPGVLAELSDLWAEIDMQSWAICEDRLAHPLPVTIELPGLDGGPSVPRDFYANRRAAALAIARIICAGADPKLIRLVAPR
jgi:hypothetical protein